MNEAALHAQVERGKDAKRILDSPLIEEAFAAIEREIVEQLKSVPERDAEGRDLLVRLLKLNGRYRAMFVGWIESGKLAAVDLERSRLQRAKEMVRKVF